MLTRFAQRVGEVKVRIRVNQEIDVKDQLRHVNKYVAQLEEKIFVVEAQRDRLQIELDKCSAHCSMAEEKNRIDRKLTVAETKTNKALVLSILSGNSTFFGNSPAQAAKTTAVDGSGSTSNHEEILHSSPSFENIRHDGFPVSPSLSGHIIDWGTQDKAVLVDLCSELAKALVMVNTEKKNAIVLQSQTSSSAAAFVAQRFAGKARRQSFNKSQSRSTSNMSVSPPGPNVAICNSAGSTSFGASHSAPNINGISDNHSTPTPGYSPPQNYAQIDISPHQNGDIQRSLDNANLDGEFVANHDAASPGSEFRDRGVSDASAISGAIFSLPAELSNTVVEQATDETEDAMRRNDVFIDMLVFGDQFLKHGRIGVCGRGLRHISVSTDLKFLCRSHINNLKSMKMIPLADINRCVF